MRSPVLLSPVMSQSSAPTMLVNAGQFANVASIVFTPDVTNEGENCALVNTEQPLNILDVFTSAAVVVTPEISRVVNAEQDCTMLCIVVTLLALNVAGKVILVNDVHVLNIRYIVDTFDASVDPIVTLVRLAQPLKALWNVVQPTVPRFIIFLILSLSPVLAK